MYLRAPVYQPTSQTFTVIFKTAGSYSKHGYSNYDTALLASLIFYCPADILAKALEKSLTRDQMRIRNLRAVKFEREKQRRQDEANAH